LEAAEQWNHAPRASDVAAIQSTANLPETIFAETAQELGCKQDNEAVLEAIAALRARAVPAIEWAPKEYNWYACLGRWILAVFPVDDGWSWCIDLGQQTILHRPPHSASPEEAKAACEAAFLRLVGAGNG
jgi:hypothetical protein